jgi:hypothetical protein
MPLHLNINNSVPNSPELTEDYIVGDSGMKWLPSTLCKSPVLLVRRSSTTSHGSGEAGGKV